MQCQILPRKKHNKRQHNNINFIKRVKFSPFLLFVQRKFLICSIYYGILSKVEINIGCFALDRKGKYMAKKKVNISDEMIDDDQTTLDEMGNMKENGKNTFKMKKEEILSMSQRRTYARHKKRVVMGALMFALMVIGVASIIGGGISFGKKLMDNTAEKQRYASLLSSIVVADPLPFESPELADPKMLLSSSIWAAVMNEDMEKYEKSEFAQTYLPAVDVDKYFSRIFGTQVKLTHQTFEDQGIEFQFDEEKQAYVIPVTSFPTGFTSKVTKIKSSFSEKVVTVGYISPAISWTDTSDGTISKYVDYIFQKQGKNFYLVAIRESATKVEVIAAQEKAKSK